MPSETVISAMRRVVDSGEPFTFQDTAWAAQNAGGERRDADRYIQKLRKAGQIVLRRVSRQTLWAKITAR